MGITNRGNKKPHSLFNGKGKASLLCSFKCVRLENMKYSLWLCASLAGAVAINLGKRPLTFMLPHSWLHALLPFLSLLPKQQPHTKKKPLNHTSNPHAHRCIFLARLVGQGVSLWGEGEWSEGRRAERQSQSSINHRTSVLCLSSMDTSLHKELSLETTKMEYNCGPEGATDIFPLRVWGKFGWL